jgi:hypothetical protein
LRWADTQDLSNVPTRLAKYEALGKRYQPTELLRKLAAGGKGFFAG